MNFSFNISSRPTITEIHELYRTNQVKPSEITEYFLAKIKEKDPEINAFFKTTGKIAREISAKLDLELLEIREKSENNLGMIKNTLKGKFFGSELYNNFISNSGYDVVILSCDVDNYLNFNRAENIEEWKIKFQQLNLSFIDLTAEDLEGDRKEKNKAIINNSSDMIPVGNGRFAHIDSEYAKYTDPKNPQIRRISLIAFSFKGHIWKIIRPNKEFVKKMDIDLDGYDGFDFREKLEQALNELDNVSFETLFNNLLLEFPLFGIPFATKAIIQLEGEIFNASSKIMDEFQAPFSATVIEKILESGAILVGITNMDQWAMGSSGESSDFGNIKNPFDLSRTPGGSSSGAAASVASGQVVFSLGTDTGGSIRQPAAFCDVVGLKPTYGLVSRWGVMPMASSLDQVGAITNTVADNMLVNKILAGKDQKDQTTIESGELIAKLSDLIAKNQNETAKKNLSLKELQNEPNRPNEIQNPITPKNDPVMTNLAKLQEKNIEPSQKNLENIKVKYLIKNLESDKKPTIRSLEANVESILDGSAQSKSPLGGSGGGNSNQKKFKIGLPREFYVDGIDPIIRKALTDLQNKLIANGHEMVQVDLPLTKYAVAVYYMTMGVEVASNLERIDGVRYGRQGEYENLFFDHRNHFGAEAKRRIMLGTYASSSGYYDAFYNQAQKVRELARLDFDTAFESCDLILTPTTPEFAFKLGSKTEDPLKMYLSDVFTCGINPVRIPGLSVPLGLFDVPNCEYKLPTGCQILAPELKEDKIYTLALEIEEIVKSGKLEN